MDPREVFVDHEQVRMCGKLTKHSCEVPVDVLRTPPLEEHYV
jgi:hypothetical protein